MERTGPQIGELLPDFHLTDRAGRAVWRRDFKGRRHLVVCCSHPAAADGGAALLAALELLHADLRAERGALLFVPPATEDAARGEVPFTVAAGPTAALRETFGATATGLLLIADRYGEIVLRAVGSEPDGGDLPVDQLVPTLAWLEMRCSL